MKNGDVCVVKCVTPGRWSEWYLAHIVEYEDGDEGGYVVLRARVVGETFDRDTFDYIYTVLPEDKQLGARKLADKQWGRLKPWGEKPDDLKQAIINAAW